MTTPGGVPNLPQGALTIDNLESKTQDMSTPAMRSRAAERFPNIFNSSTGGNALNDLTPIGIITQIFSGFNSIVANADPADVQGPEDLPGLLLDFIESLPVVGELIGLLEAITGTYAGDDPVLLEVQTIFAPIRAIVDSLLGLSGGLSGLGNFFPDILGLLGNPTGLGTGSVDPIAWAEDFVNNILNPTGLLASIEQIVESITGISGGSLTDLLNFNVLGGDSPLNALNIFGNLPEYLFGLIPAGSIGATNPNLLSNPGFDGDVSVSGGGGWVWDSVTGRTTAGSAKATANGTLLALHSNTVPVTEGQVLNVSTWVKSTSYVGTGTPIRIGVRTFLNGATVGTSTIASTGAATAWTQLSGTYTVPAGVDSLRLRNIVDTTMTSGTVNFDDASLTKQGNGPFDGILDLFGLGALDDLIGLNPVTIWQTIITSFLNPSSLLEDGGIRDFIKGLLDQLTSILRLIPFVGGGLADALDNFADSMDSLNQSNIGNAATISQIQAALGSGVPDADDFERATLGSNWRTITSSGGTVSLNGHDLVMAHTQDTDYVLLKTDKSAGSDNQTCEIVLGSAPGFNTILVDSARGHNDIWLRCSDFTTWATRTGVRCRWSAQNKNIKLSAFVNGSEVVTMFNAAASSASAGSKLSLETGAGGNPRRFVIRINGSIIAGGDVVESGTASQLGATYRRRGLGGKTEHVGIDPLGASPDPGTVKQWTATG